MSVDILGEAIEGLIELSLSKLQLVHCVEEKPGRLPAIRFPSSEACLLRWREEIDNRFSVKGLQRDEESEAAVLREARRLFAHLDGLSGPGLGQQDDPGVLQEVRPADIRTELRFAPRDELLGIFELGFRQFKKSSLDVDKVRHAWLGRDIRVEIVA